MNRPRSQAAHGAQDYADLLEALLEEASDALLLLDSAGVVRTVLASAGNLTTDPAEFEGQALADLVDPDDAPKVQRVLKHVTETSGANGSAETRMRFRDSSVRPVELLVRNRLDRPAVGAVVVVVRDISERKAREDRLREDALHDPLTALPNRTLFTDRLAQALQRQRRSSGRVAILFVDIDDFKSVNDRLGHRAGDELMVAIASRLSGSLRASDTAARLGGDEFGILVEGASQADACEVADRILKAFAPPFSIDGYSCEVTASIGIATSLDAADTGSELLRRADLAMYAAKMSDRRGQYEVFQPRTEDALRAAQDSTSAIEVDPVNVVRLDRAQRERSEIRALLEDVKAVRSVFQPIVDLRTGRVVGYEALTRFPTLLRGPAEVFAQAQRCGLGSFLEAIAIATALRAAGRPGDTFISLNVSPTALLSRELARLLPTSLDEIVVEVTEQELEPRSDLVQEALALVRGRGARIAVDDAGAGYAGLRHLTDFSPDMIKIDQDLIQGAHRDLHKGALIESLVNYARRIEASTCAEGIEDPADLEFVQASGVDFVQGFLIARPAEPWGEPEKDIVERLVTTAADSDGAQPAGSPRERLAAVLARAARWHDVDQVLGLIAITLAVDRIYLSRFEAVERYVTMVAAHGRTDYYDVPYPLAEYPTTAQVIDRVEPRAVSVRDPAADPHEVELLLNEGMTAGLLYPVLCDGDCVGLLEIYSRRERNWTQHEEQYLAHVVDNLGTTMARLGTRAAPDTRSHR
jgi:diguanylate cyclase (GGDEF)-like protein/PAS domain S-box-containing protein